MVIFGTVSQHDECYTYSDSFSRLLFSAQYSLEMFFANTVALKREVYTVLKDNHDLFYGYFTIYFAAILTSAFAIFHFLPRRWFSSIWLTTNQYKSTNKKSHIFVGINPASLHLAGNIDNDSYDGDIIFIDTPDEQDYPQGISIWDFLSTFFKDKKDKVNLDKYVVLKSGKGLRKLCLWLQNKDNKIYFLSENQNKNLAMLEELLRFKDSTKCKELGLSVQCHMYCHAKKEGLVNRYDTIADKGNQVTVVDSSFLAVESMKKDKSGDLLPVKYVDVAEKDKRKLGYVTSDFNCAVIGFGETGKEALKFLYEYGAFPSENKKKSPFKCHIFDKVGLSHSWNHDLTAYRDPDVEENEAVFYPYDINSAEFWKEMKRIIHKLNYIVVCLGDDKINMQVAIDLAEFAVINGRDLSDKFVIAVKQTEPCTLANTTLKSAKVAFNNCIKEFGLPENIWTMDVISNEEMTQEASKFYTSYVNLSERLDRIMAEANGYEYKKTTWEDRNEKLKTAEYPTRCKILRQISQDFSNCMHKNTKKALCSLGQEAADEIYDVNDANKHSKDSNADVLEYLAIGEHLRWNASQIIMGYKPTASITDATDDFRKLHNSLRPYSQLDDRTRHYDWLVVKNSLKL